MTTQKNLINKTKRVILAAAAFILILTFFATKTQAAISENDIAICRQWFITQCQNRNYAVLEPLYMDMAVLRGLTEQQGTDSFTFLKYQIESWPATLPDAYNAFAQWFRDPISEDRKNYVIIHYEMVPGFIPEGDVYGYPDYWGTDPGTDPPGGGTTNIYIDGDIIVDLSQVEELIQVIITNQEVMYYTFVVLIALLFVWFIYKTILAMFEAYI